MHSFNYKSLWWLSLFVVILTVVSTYFCINFFYGDVSSTEDFILQDDTQRLSLTSDTSIFSDNAQLSIPMIISNSLDSIVGISVLEPSNDSIFDLNVAQKWGIGTGVIVSENGYIITNQHLASRVNSIVYITLNNGKSVQGKVIWNEKNIDLAIVKINETNLTPILLGDSDEIVVGEEVIAIGNPLGMDFQRSATKGIVSGINRTLKIEDDVSSVIMEDLIQTDASINTGNSGGPLINSNGEIIGINTVKISSAEGIGFAVPINVVKPIIEKLISNNKFSEAYLGLYAYDNSILSYLNDSISADGIYVADVISDSPAEKSGIKVGDVITKIDGIKITKMMELRKNLYSKEPGDTILLSLIRNKKQYEFSITLGSK